MEENGQECGDERKGFAGGTRKRGGLSEPRAEAEPEGGKADKGADSNACLSEEAEQNLLKTAADVGHRLIGWSVDKLDDRVRSPAGQELTSVFDDAYLVIEGDEIQH